MHPRQYPATSGQRDALRRRRFVVVLPDTAPVGASQIAEQFRSATSALAIVRAGGEYGRVTASIGAASWFTDQQGDSAA